MTRATLGGSFLKTIPFNQKSLLKFSNISPGGLRILAMLYVSPRRRIGWKLLLKNSGCNILAYSEEMKLRQYVHEFHIRVIKTQKHCVFATSRCSVSAFNVLLFSHGTEIIEYFDHAECWGRPLGITAQGPVMFLVA